MNTPAVLTVPEAAALLRISRSAAYEAVRTGKLPSVVIGRSVRVPRHRLEELLGLDAANDERLRSVAAYVGAGGALEVVEP